MGAAFGVIRRTFIDWYDSMILLAVLNLLWLLSVVTVVLFPPATAAMYAVAYEITHEGSSSFSEFMQAGRRYFVKSWIWALINLAVLVLAWSNIVFYGAQGTDLAAIVQMIFVILTIYWLIIQFYVWPFFMEQREKRVLLALRNATLTALAAPGFTVLMVVVVVALLVASVVFVLPAGVMTAAIIALMGVHAVTDRLVAFGKVQSPENEAAPDAAEATAQGEGQDTEE